jgi:hypothetical protein
LIKHFRVNGRTFSYDLDVNIYFSEYNAIFANDKGEEAKEANKFYRYLLADLEKHQKPTFFKKILRR